MIKTFIHLAVTVLSAVFLVWFILPMAYGIRNIGNIFGIALCGALIIRFGFSGVYGHFKEWMCDRCLTTVIMRVIQISAGAFAVYAAVVSCMMIFAFCTAPTGNSTAVVLGAQVKPWGVSHLLRQRIEAAQDYLEEHPDAVAVLSGAQGEDEPMSEAQCIYEELTAAGIDPKRLYREEKAQNTQQNIRYSLDVIEDNGLNKDLAIVTDSYHQLRARIITHKIDRNIRVGAVNSVNNYVGWIAYPTYFVREWIAIPAEILK